LFKVQYSVYFSLSPQPPNDFSLACIQRLNFLINICNILEDNLDITKSGVAGHKFLTPFFSDRIICDKLKPCKYFTLFFFVFVSKFKLLKFENMALKTAR
jgi:hypothetical protein